MNEYLGMLLAGIDPEWVHFASGVGTVVLGGLGTVFWFYYRRDLNRGDAAAADRQKTLDAHEDQLRSHARQIRDTRAAVACCETSLKIEHYPYTD